MDKVAESSSHLKKGVLTLTDVLVSGLANMGPAMSIFFTIAIIVGSVGKAASFEVILALLAILTLGNSMAQFSRKIPSSGSFITFIGRTFGTPVATVGALMLVVGYIIAVSGVMAVLGGWVATLIERYTGGNVSWIILMVIGAAIIALLTIRGVKVSAQWAIVLFAFEALILVVLSLVILFHGGKHGLSLQPFNPFQSSGGLNGIALAFPMVIFIFVGWENSGALAEETLNPRRNVPRAVYFAIILIAILYILSTYAANVGYGMSPNELKAFANDDAPFDTLGKVYLGSGRFLVDIAGFTSIFATIVAAANSQARILYNAGREGLLPKVFGKISPKGGTPHVALLTYLGVSMLLAIVFGFKTGPYNYFGDGTTLGTIPLILIYASANVALPVYFLKNHRSEFRVWKHLIVPLVGVAVLIWPFWGLIQPGQPWPFNTFPLIVLGLLIVSILWTIVLAYRNPQLSTTALEVFSED